MKQDPDQRTPDGGLHVEPRHGASTAVWSAESLLESAHWRERHRADAPVDAPAVLELGPEVPLRSRLKRAVAVPVIAGGAVFVVAVLIAITMTLLQGHDAGAAETAADAGRETAVAASGQEPGPASGASGSAPAGRGASESGTVFVHVVGAVVEPGLVELPAGSRVADAVEAAGGSRKSAVLTGINLARVLADGEQVVVPDGSENSPDSDGGSARAAAGATGESSDGATVRGGGSALVELNSADLAALETLPGVGPALAQRIVDRREQSGPFTDVEQLLEVSGIGPKVFEGLRERVTLR